MKTVYSTEEFKKALENERSRSDRKGTELSIVAFKINKHKDSETIIDHLRHVLCSRTRFYDEIGYISDQRFGVMLPDTPYTGAKKFADDVCKLILPEVCLPNYSITTYPTQWLQHEKTDPKNRTLSRSIYLQNSGGTYSPLKHLGPVLPKRISVWKRIMDIVIASVGLILISPLFLLIAAFIKIVSPGPVFYKQKRIGYLGETFKCLKFRTMKIDSSISCHQQHISEIINRNSPLTKLDKNDPRIIPLGEFMRKIGLDELPQLINVFIGKMSIIGPRPCIPYESRNFDIWQHKRFDILPGITGLWQVNGKNRTTFNDMIRYDITYAQQRSFWLDITILFKTIPAIIRQFRY